MGFSLFERSSSSGRERGPHLPASDSGSYHLIQGSWRLGCSLLLKRGHQSIKSPVVAQPVANVDELGAESQCAMSPRRESESVYVDIIVA